MKHLATLAIILAFASVSISGTSAACFGTPGFQTCSDSYGNNYTVNRLGSMTFMNGNNPSTGSTWSQNSQNLGPMTMHNGVTTGRSWYMHEQSFGGMTTYNGINAAGRTFSYTCTAFGCN